jgi:hypothetical protein
MGQFTIAFHRIRPSDDAHATLDKVRLSAPDLQSAKVKAMSMFYNLDMPQKPDGFCITNGEGEELFRWVWGDAF